LMFKKGGRDKPYEILCIKHHSRKEKREYHIKRRNFLQYGSWKANLNGKKRKRNNPKKKKILKNERKDGRERRGDRVTSGGVRAFSGRAS